jgi:hypothetical protein
MKVIEWINTGIFPATIMLSVGFDYHRIINELNELNAHEWVGPIDTEEDKALLEQGKNFALKREHNGRTYFYIIFIDDFGFTDYEMCKLAHEVLHICQFMLPDFLDVLREYECYAYTHTHIMEQCLKKLR